MPGRCHDVAGDLHEALAGTAPLARRWLLVEHHGPWGRDALSDSGFPDDVVAAVKHRLATVEGRFQLIRRHRDGLRGLGTAVIVCSSDPDDPWARRFEVESVDDLVAIPVDDAAREDVRGVDVDRPILLVCTHARRDACCAQWGRPLAGLLAGRSDVDVWETSHTGGHRFAPNLVILPEGIVYGRADVPLAAELLDRHRYGRLNLECLRGRSCDDPWGQAADVAVRRHLSLDGIDAVQVLQTEPDGDSAVVDLAVEDGNATVHLRRVPSGVLREVSCGAEELTDPGVIEVVEIQLRERVA